MRPAEERAACGARTASRARCRAPSPCSGAPRVEERARRRRPRRASGSRASGSCIAFATRSGVLSSPSRPGSSPTSASCSCTSAAYWSTPRRRRSPSSISMRFCGLSRLRGAVACHASITAMLRFSRRRDRARACRSRRRLIAWPTRTLLDRESHAPRRPHRQHRQRKVDRRAAPQRARRDDHRRRRPGAPRRRGRDPGLQGDRRALGHVDPRSRRDARPRRAAAHRVQRARPSSSSSTRSCTPRSSACAPRSCEQARHARRQAGRLRHPAALRAAR